jgi:hypothetical protein
MKRFGTEDARVRRSARFVLLPASLVLVDFVIAATTIAIVGGLFFEPLATSLFAIPFLVVGGLIVAREPRNKIGWILSFDGLILSILAALRPLADQTLSSGDSAGPIVAWVDSWLYVPMVYTTASFLPLIFPSGQLPSPRWRIVSTISALSIVGKIAASLVRPGPLQSHPDVPNPFGFEGPLGSAFQLLGGLTAGVLSVSMLLAVASLGFRYVNGSGEERAQLRWLSYATVTVVAVGIANAIRPVDAVTSVAYGVSFLFLPLAIGIAVFRYRLYDIDVLINRTLVYGAVSATLAATYTLAVVALQSLLRPVTGGSEFAVALSTLLVVALFQPIRRRAQDAVDRSFYRARYDAARTIDAFSVRLRSDVELDSVRADLIAVIHDTIHPAHASVWLRSGRR